MISDNSPLPNPEPYEHWYILKVETGSEFLAEEQFQELIDTGKLPGLFDVLLPTEEYKENFVSQTSLSRLHDGAMLSNRTLV